MIVGKLSELVESIQQSAIPKWLYDYVNQNREKITYELNQQGVCKISGPNAMITITKK